MKRIFLFGPILFATVLTELTIINYDFLRDLGWDLINDPTFDRPVGLALGKYGFVMTATFIISGLIIFLFATALIGTLREPQRSASSLLSLLMQTNPVSFIQSSSRCPGIHHKPTYACDTPATWHGQLHDLSFVLLGHTLLPAMLIFGKTFQDDIHWRGYGIYTWLNAALAIPAFIVKGAAFYIFLFSVLLWNEIIA